MFQGRVAPGRERFAAMAGIGGVSAMAESPDGKWLAAGSYDTDVRVWKIADAELVRLIDELKVSMFDMRFSPDGKSLAMAGADRTIYIWETGTWKLSRKITGPPELIVALRFSQDGQRLVTGGFNDANTKLPVSVIVWDAATGRMLKKAEVKRTVSDVAFSPDGKRVAAAYLEKEIRLLEVG
jgi:WD40 repeat protein